MEDYSHINRKMHLRRHEPFLRNLIQKLKDSERSNEVKMQKASVEMLYKMITDNTKLSHETLDKCEDAIQKLYSQREQHRGDPDSRPKNPDWRVYRVKREHEDRPPRRPSEIKRERRSPSPPRERIIIPTVDKQRNQAGSSRDTPSSNNQGKSNLRERYVSYFDVPDIMPDDPQNDRFRDPTEIPSVHESAGFMDPDEFKRKYRSDITEDIQFHRKSIAERVNDITPAPSPQPPPQTMRSNENFRWNNGRDYNWSNGRGGRGNMDRGRGYRDRGRGFGQRGRGYNDRGRGYNDPRKNRGGQSFTWTGKTEQSYDEWWDDGEPQEFTSDPQVPRLQYQPYGVPPASILGQIPINNPLMGGTTIPAVMSGPMGDLDLRMAPNGVPGILQMTQNFSAYSFPATSTVETKPTPAPQPERPAVSETPKKSEVLLEILTDFVGAGSKDEALKLLVRKYGESLNESTKEKNGEKLPDQATPTTSDQAGPSTSEVAPPTEQRRSRETKQTKNNDNKRRARSKSRTREVGLEDLDQILDSRTRKKDKINYSESASEAKPSKRKSDEGASSSKKRKTDSGSVDNNKGNTDKNNFWTKNAASCKFCSFNGKGLVNHYKWKHHEKEVYCARLSPEDSLIAVKDSKKNLGLYEQQTLDTFKGKFLFKCRFCSLLIKDVAEKVFEHITTHTGEFRHRCNICNYRAAGKATVKYHFMKYHKREPQDLDIVTKPFTKSIIFGYMCSVCNYLQIKKKNIINHMRKYHVDRTDLHKINFSTEAPPKKKTPKPKKKSPIESDEEEEEPQEQNVDLSNILKQEIVNDADEQLGAEPLDINDTLKEELYEASTSDEDTEDEASKPPPPPPPPSGEQVILKMINNEVVIKREPEDKPVRIKTEPELQEDDDDDVIEVPIPVQPPINVDDDDETDTDEAAPPIKTEPPDPVETGPKQPEISVKKEPNAEESLIAKVKREIEQMCPPPLIHHRKLSAASSEQIETLDGGLVKIVKTPDSFVFCCLVPPCIFSSDQKDLFTKHCRDYHAIMPDPIACKSCHMRCPETEQAKGLVLLFQHFFDAHALFFVRLTVNQ